MLLTEGESGTADAAIVDLDNMRLEAHDLKDGQGAVDVIDNDQLIPYMLALMFQMEADYFCEFQEFECFIHQPKVYAEPQSVAHTREEMLGALEAIELRGLPQHGPAAQGCDTAQDHLSAQPEL